MHRAAVAAVIALLVAAAGSAVGYLLGAQGEETVTVTTTTWRTGIAASGAWTFFVAGD